MTIKRKVTCIAPINIAVVKYWGKSDEKYNIPLNPSLSVTLDTADLCTKTSIALDDTLDEDQLWLNGRKEDISKNNRMQRCLQEARRLCLKRKIDNESEENIARLKCIISSKNNFPTAAGLASSASGYACLAKCLGEIYDLKVDLSTLARLGSGSACRSIHGGFVKWKKGECPLGTDSNAEQIAPEIHWPNLKCLILVVSNKHKSTPSTDGMRRSVGTSELLKYRVDQIVDKRMVHVENAIIEKDFAKFAELTMKDSNQLHAICQDTYPPITPPYMNETSHQIVNLITKYNDPSVKAAYTFDAGANAVLFTLDEHFEELLGTVLKYFPFSEETHSFVNLPEDKCKKLCERSITLNGLSECVGALQRIIVTKPGPGVQVIL